MRRANWGRAQGMPRLGRPEAGGGGEGTGPEWESRDDCWGTRFSAKVRARGAWAGRERRRSCEMDVRVAEEAEVDREEAGRVPPSCGYEFGGEVTREVRRR